MDKKRFKRLYGLYRYHRKYEERRLVNRYEFGAYETLEDEFSTQAIRNAETMYEATHAEYTEESPSA